MTRIKFSIFSNRRNCDESAFAILFLFAIIFATHAKLRAKVRKIFQICKFIFFSLVNLVAGGCQIYFSCSFAIIRFSSSISGNALRSSSGIFKYIAGEIEARRRMKQLCRHLRLNFGSRWLPFFLIRHFGSRWLPN